MDNNRLALCADTAPQGTTQPCPICDIPTPERHRTEGTNGTIAVYLCANRHAFDLLWATP